MTAPKLSLAGAAVAAAALLALAGLAGCQRGDGNQPAPGKAASSTAPAGPGAARAAVTPSAQAMSGKAGLAAPHKAGDKPQWRTLTPAQQLALEPLAAEWDAMDGVRKQKWLQLAGRFSAMKPEEQERVHARMREWTKLTPEQRELARETYSRTRKITADQKTATWESYQQLPDAQKQKLAASADGRKSPSMLPSQTGGKAVAPLGHGATSCPAGTARNSVSATPPCVAAPGSLAVPPSAAPAPLTPPANAPGTPTQPSPQDKQVPANWGITPNNA